MGLLPCTKSPSDLPVRTLHWNRTAADKLRRNKARSEIKCYSLQYIGITSENIDVNSPIMDLWVLSRPIEVGSGNGKLLVGVADDIVKTIAGINHGDDYMDAEITRERLRSRKE
jgi:hypothetical protein